MEKWDELIDWQSRAESEGDFFIEALKEHNAREVLDVATGTGFHSVRLIEAGFEVVCGVSDYLTEFVPLSLSGCWSIQRSWVSA